MSSSISAILAKLEHYRTHAIRQPEEVAALGQALIEREWLSSAGDEAWIFLEQVAVAAAECGNVELAETCAARLDARFPGSPRVNVLLGTIMEARGLNLAAKSFYEKALVENESDLSIRKRLISLHLNSPTSTSSSKSKAVVTSGASSTALSRERGLEMLVEYLDAVYNDAEGWAELASVYASMGLYAQSLTALAHLIILAPHNPYHLLQHAETAYTLGDIPLAYKEMLRVVEMSDGVVGVGGVGRRAAMGVKLCLARLKAGTQEGVDLALKPKQVNQVDLLVTKLVLAAYKAPKAVERAVVESWIGSA